MIQSSGYSGAASNSHWEQMLAFQVKAVALPAPVFGFRLPELPNRPFDLAWPDSRLLVEIHGGTGTFVQGRKVRGRHVSPEGFEADRQKMNTAVLAGYRVLEFTGRHVKSGLAIRWIEKALTK